MRKVSYASGEQYMTSLFYLLMAKQLQRCRTRAAKSAGWKKGVPDNVMAGECKSTFLFIDRDSILGLCRNEERFLSIFPGISGDRVDFFGREALHVDFDIIRQRLANQILKLFREDGSEFEFGITREKLTDLFGIARPSLSRVFPKMVSDGIIVQIGKRIRVNDPETLRKIFDEEA